MAKLWTPMPEPIMAALEKQVAERYPDEIAGLPKLGSSNPGITYEVTVNGFSATVRFYYKTGSPLSSQWDYSNDTERWIMSQDWND